MQVVLLQCGCLFNLEVCREQELSIQHEALHLRETDVVLREHELVTQKGQHLWKSGAVNFKTRLFVRSHLVFEMDAVMKELLGHLIAQFLAIVITMLMLLRITVTQQPCQDGMLM